MRIRILVILVFLLVMLTGEASAYYDSGYSARLWYNITSEDFGDSYTEISLGTPMMHDYGLASYQEVEMFDKSVPGTPATGINYISSNGEIGVGDGNATKFRFRVDRSLPNFYFRLDSSNLMGRWGVSISFPFYDEDDNLGSYGVFGTPDIKKGKYIELQNVLRQQDQLREQGYDFTGDVVIEVWLYDNLGFGSAYSYHVLPTDDLTSSPF